MEAESTKATIWISGAGIGDWGLACSDSREGPKGAKARRGGAGSDNTEWAVMRLHGAVSDPTVIGSNHTKTNKKEWDLIAL